MTSIDLSGSGPPETVLAPVPDDWAAGLAAALALPEAEQRDAMSALAATYPGFLDAWAHLGRLGRDVMESYSAFRVGYHRGLDALRQSGWRGSGYVRWEHETNRGFLMALAGLQRCAEEIGETAEDERCATFLRQLDPNWPPANPFG